MLQFVGVAMKQIKDEGIIEIYKIFRYQDRFRVLKAKNCTDYDYYVVLRIVGIKEIEGTSLDNLK